MQRLTATCICYPPGVPAGGVSRAFSTILRSRSATLEAIVACQFTNALACLACFALAFASCTLLQSVTCLLLQGNGVPPIKERGIAATLENSVLVPPNWHAPAKASSTDCSRAV